MENLEIIPKLNDRGVLIIKVIGFVDASNITLFDRRMHEAVENGYSKIILDLSELQYINSSALGILLDIHLSANKRKGDLRILNLPRKMQKTFDVLGFNDYFQIFNDEKSAVYSFS
ncbi:MAG: STAS domain-containing protein [Deltaproteobacteria bacterium]|nr:MAG: STAS domain-containing protein [Deltaproteobacteria bacterium]